MGYQVKLSPEFAESFRNLPRSIWDFVKNHIHTLASDPVNLSRRSALPYPPNCQLYHLQPPCSAEGYRHHLTILFRYGQDETSIELIGLGHVAERIGDEGAP